MAIKTTNINKEIQYIDDFFERLEKNQQAYNEFLYKTGFYTKNGNLKRKYKTS